jgi:hypothetical protein
VDQFDYIVVGPGSAVGEYGTQSAISRGWGRDLNPWLHIPISYFQQTRIGFLSGHDGLRVVDA